MPRYIPPNARLASKVDASRLELAECDGRHVPQVGDLVHVDQGFTNADGQNMYIVYCQHPDGRIKWAADLFDAELEPLNRGLST